MSAPIVDVYLTPDHADRSLRVDARLGLTGSPKWLQPKWFYDARGSELFEQITRLPEYYPTRTERSILDAHAGDIARRTGAHTLVELGSGSSEKTRLLLDALQEAGTLRQYVPLDVSETALREAVEAIHGDYPGLSVHGVVADFTEHLDRIPGQAPRLVAFLGGTIGNFFPDERATFLRALRDTLVPGEWLLLGTDLVKDPDVLVPAYDDEAGVTADFNRNVLAVLNRELGADFDVESFEHVAVWDPVNEWIEMRLRSARSTAVTLSELNLDISLRSGEEIRTEISSKFRREGVENELAKAGFGLDSWMTDPGGLFALSLARAR
ncbi:MAG: L-histidine Nalpha-methyltransferase [Actinomycetota bacterium]|jgi:L-histidine N-alpha-methyltransferase|nr:L-histidine Nalpha-methyltransferase [Actinomycetota bacterium]